MTFTKPQLFQEARDKLGSRSPVGSTLTSSEWAALPTALRERAFFSATIQDVRFLQQVKDLLGDYLASARETLPNGELALKVGSRARFIELAREFAIERGLGPIDPRDAGTIKDITSERRLALIFDIQVTSARQYGNWLQGMDADVLYYYPAQRFIRESEVTTPRPLHDENEGVVKLKTDLPFWLRMNGPAIGGFGVPWGPWGFNSGMGVEDVDRQEAEDLDLLGPDDVPQPIIKDFNDHLQAGIGNLDADIVEWLKRQFGSQIHVEGDSIVWRSGADKPIFSPPKTLPPAPTQTSAPAPKESPEKGPVSTALILPKSTQLRPLVKTALAAIDKVHDDGALPVIPIVPSRTDRFLGALRFSGNTPAAPGRPLDISITEGGPWPALTTVHEVGHFLDLTVLVEDSLKGKSFGSRSNPAMKPILDSIRQSDAHKAITDLRATAESEFNRRLTRYLDELLLDYELWARAYAQYIATKSKHPGLRKSLAKARINEPFRQWTDADFAPIAEAIDAFFRAKGWL